MLPSIFGENLFDDMWDDVFDSMSAFNRRNPLYGKHGKNMMKTDVRETDNSYELDIDLPGFKKDEVKVDLKNGYLTISASKSLDKTGEKKNERYIRRERYSGQMARSFYVGDVKEEDIEAQLDNGILEIKLPKENKEKKNTKRIEIK